MLPPMTRMERVSADTVAIRSSGQMMVVMMEAGTTMPPMPRPAMIKMIQSTARLSGRATAMAPVPAVMKTLETIMSARL
jgi:hypothetical protein